MAQIVLHVLILFLFTFIISATGEEVILNVVNFAAKPNGEIDSTNAFLSAWSRACSSTTPTTIYVPLGRFLVGKVVFKGRCNNKGITIRIDGALIAPSNYDVIGNSGNWLYFDDVDGISVIGGVLDGQGTALWACKRSGKTCPTGATVCIYALQYSKYNIIFFRLA